MPETLIETDKGLTVTAFVAITKLIDAQTRQVRKYEISKFGLETLMNETAIIMKKTCELRDAIRDITG